MLVSDTGCCAQKMMKHSTKQGAPRIGRTLKNPHTIETPVSLQHWSSWWARVDYASRASKKAPQGPFCRRDVWRRPMLFESTLGYALKSFGQKRNSSIFTTLEFLVGAGGFEPPKLKSSRFTVCPHWPLGNTPIYSSSQSRTACIYYHLGAYLSTAFYSFFRKEADRTAQSRGRP